VLVRAEEKVWIRRRCLNSIENCNNMLAQPWKVKLIVDEHLVHVSTFLTSFTAVWRSVSCPRALISAKTDSQALVKVESASVVVLKSLRVFVRGASES